MGMLTTEDREEILRLIKSSKDARAIYRANTLNLSYKSLTASEVADFLEITPRTVFMVNPLLFRAKIG